MSDAAAEKFGCEGCGKLYSWKPELSGKRVKCKCGGVMTVPDLGGPPALPDDVYDVADEPKPQPVSRAAAQAASAGKPASASGKPASARPAAGAAAPRSAASTRPGATGGGKTLAYQSGPNKRQREAAATLSYEPVREVWVPTGMIAGALLILGLQMFRKYGFTTPMYLNSAGLVIGSLIGAGLMIAGAFAIGSKVGISFGGIWTAVLKMIACVLIVDMTTSWLDALIGSMGFYITIFIAFAMYWGLFAYLFAMDAEDAVWIVSFFTGLKVLLGWLMIPILLGALTGGGSAVTTVAGGAATILASASSAVVERDEKIDYNRENKFTIEAKEFIEKKARYREMTPLVEKWYAAGAKDVFYEVSRDINGKTEAISLCVELPAEPDKRKECHAILKTYLIEVMQDTDVKDGDPELADESGKYLVMGLPR